VAQLEILARPTEVDIVMNKTGVIRKKRVETALHSAQKARDVAIAGDALWKPEQLLEEVLARRESTSRRSPVRSRYAPSLEQAESARLAALLFSSVKQVESAAIRSEPLEAGGYWRTTGAH
jgi:hypothetical protein